MRAKLQKYLPALIGAAVCLGAARLFVRFVLPLLAPFLAAFALAAALEPGVRALAARGVGRRVASALLCLAAISMLLAIVGLLASRLLGAVSSFAVKAPQLMGAVGSRLSETEERVLAFAASAPEGTEEYLRAALDALGGALNALPGELSARLIGAAGRAAQGSPGALLFAATAAIGSYFCSASYPAVLVFLRAQLPVGAQRRISELGRDLRSDLGGWLRAQLILAALTFAELLILFALLRVRRPLLLAALTALVDALPVFGTGAVLVPWALYLLLLGRTGRAAALLAGWALGMVLRDLAQAKLVGDRIGLHPLVSLLAVYVGWRAWGVGGMLVLPLVFAALCRLNSGGVVRLWNRP